MLVDLLQSDIRLGGGVGGRDWGLPTSIEHVLALKQTITVSPDDRNGATYWVQKGKNYRLFLKVTDRLSQSFWMINFWYSDWMIANRCNVTQSLLFIYMYSISHVPYRHMKTLFIRFGYCIFSPETVTCRLHVLQ